MSQKYSRPDQIPDQAIKDEFVRSTEVSFSARRYNDFKYRSICFGNLGWWLPLTRVLPLIGITPQMLRPVFTPQQTLIPQHFPFNLSWFGLNQNRHRIEEVELPEIIETYEQLGNFPLTDEPFFELARVLGKSVRVMREDGETGDHNYLFTAHPPGFQ